jgi:hypothetical protein
VVTIDVERLIETRMLVQANSGAGKSFTLRRILEQTYGHVQHIVIDVEGEFHTLREIYDYVLCAPRGGDCVADTRSAALLARRLLELGASAIIDIYELGASQARFVRLFLESLMSAPRDLWHSVLVVVDEAHKFCAEKEEAESASAVIDLMTRGRKRGFCGVLATQRLSKLDKDAAAEANNLLIGRTALDLDVSRAALVLGVPLKDARGTLPKLTSGEFFCVGPALSSTVERIHIGHVETSHPKAGSRGAPPTPPRDKVRAILSKLADLPAEAEEELKTVAELRKKIRELEAHARDDVNIGKLDERAAALEKRVLATEAERDDARAMEQVQSDLLDRVVNEIDTIIGTLGDLRNEIPDALQAEAEREPGKREPGKHGAMWGALVREYGGDSKPGGDSVFVDPASPPLVITDVKRALIDNDYSNMPAMQRAMLTVLAQRTKHLPMQGTSSAVIPKAKILVWSGYSRGGATSKAFADLVKQGWAMAEGGGLGITREGLRALGAYTALPKGLALREQIASGLPEMERKIFAVVCAEYPSSLAKSNILLMTGYSRGGATSKAFAYLVARDYLVADGPGKLRAAKELFE